MLQGTRYPSLGGLDWPRYLPILIMQGFLNYVAVHFIVCALRFPEENNEASDTGFCHPCVGNTSCRGRGVPRSCWLLSFWNLCCWSASYHRVCWCVIWSHAAWCRVWPTVLVTCCTVDICPLFLNTSTAAQMWQGRLTALNPFYYQLMHIMLKKTELLKHFKLDKNAPTCFGLHRNHRQGAKVSAWLKITHLVNSIKVQHCWCTV